VIEQKGPVNKETTVYFRVYSPDGEPFDVTRDRADKLLLEEGWTQTPASVDTPFDQEPITEDEITEDEIGEVITEMASVAENDIFKDLHFVEVDEDVMAYVPKAKPRARKTRSTSKEE